MTAKVAAIAESAKLEKYKLATMISTSVTKVSPPARNVKRYGFLALHGSPRGQMAVTTRPTPIPRETSKILFRTGVLAALKFKL